MANWQMKLDFSEAKECYRDGIIDVFVFAKMVAKEIASKVSEARKIDEDLGDELEFDILPMFREFETDNSLTIDDFDNMLVELYDWGDTSLDDGWPRKKMCWIVP